MQGPGIVREVVKETVCVRRPGYGGDFRDASSPQDTAIVDPCRGGSAVVPEIMCSSRKTSGYAACSTRAFSRTLSGVGGLANLLHQAITTSSSRTASNKFSVGRRSTGSSLLFAAITSASR